MVDQEITVSSGDDINPGRVIEKADIVSGNLGSENFVKRETYLKAVNQEKNLRLRLKEMEDQLKDVQTKDEQRERKALEEQNEFKKLYEIHKAKADNLETQMHTFQESLIDGHKLQAVIDGLPGKIKKREYYQFIDTSGIAYDPDSKSIDEESVRSTINKFVESYPDLIDVKESRRLPNDSPAPTMPKGIKEQSLQENLTLLGQLVAKRG